MAELTQIQVNGTTYDIHADKANKDSDGNNIKDTYAKATVIKVWGEND